MEKIYLIIDESGAKGYSNNQEQELAELGLILGYLIPESHIKKVKEELNDIRNKYISQSKLHITDLTSQEQNNLRKDIFNYFQNRQIYFVYEAIHVQGFFNNQQSLLNLIKQSKENSNPNIAFSNHEKKELLHKQLFQGLVGKAICMCIDKVGNTFYLDIISDNIDKSIQKEFIKAIDELINIGKKNTKHTKAYDKVKKEPLNGSITFEIDNSSNTLEDYSNIKYSISYEDTGLTLASDVLANSLYYYFHHRDNNKIGKHLNTKKAVKNFPLKDLIYGLWEDDNINYFADAIYMHPDEEKNLKTLERNNG